MANDVFKIRMDNDDDHQPPQEGGKSDSNKNDPSAIPNDHVPKSTPINKTSSDNSKMVMCNGGGGGGGGKCSAGLTPSNDYEDAPSEENISFGVAGSNASGHLITATSTNTSLLTLKANLFSVLTSLLFLMFAMLFNLAILAVIHERVPFGEPPLPDVAFDLLPKQDQALYISEYIIMFMSLSVTVLIIFHYYRWIIFQRLCLILGILYIFRAVCVAVTQLPVSNQQYYCSPRLNLTEINQWEMAKIILGRIVFMSVGMGLSVNGHHTFCGDFIFSGHTVILVTSDLFLVYYWLSNRRKFGFILIKYCYHMLVLIGIVAILVARGHYLIDIILGFFLTKLVFYIYHILCHYSIMQSRYMEPLSMIHHHHDHDHEHHGDSHSSDVVQPADRSRSYLRVKQPNPLNTWWFNLFHFFEANTIKNCIIVENRFQMPCNVCRRQSNLMMI